MPLLGAHMSIAGGYFKAIERAVAAGCDCVQIFTTPPRQWPVQAPKTDSRSGRLLTKNNNQWRAKELMDDDVSRFRRSLEENASIQATLSHASYLVNLATPDDELRQKSVEALIVELERGDRLGVPYVVFHPGAHIELDPDRPKSYKQSLDEAIEALGGDTPSRRGLQRIVDCVNAIHARTEALSSQLLF